MKYMPFTILALLSLIAFSSCSKPTHDSVAEAEVELVEDLAKILGGVDDEASAKAAAKKIEELAERIDETKKLGEELGEPSEDVKKELKSKYDERRGKAMNDFISAMSKLGAKPELTKHLDDSLKKLNTF